MDLEILKCTWLLPPQIQPNLSKLIQHSFTVQMNNDPEDTAKTTQEFLKAKR